MKQLKDILLESLLGGKTMKHTGSASGFGSLHVGDNLYCGFTQLRSPEKHPDSISFYNVVITDVQYGKIPREGEFIRISYESKAGGVEDVFIPIEFESEDEMVFALTDTRSKYRSASYKLFSINPFNLYKAQQMLDNESCYFKTTDKFYAKTEKFK